jgi:hypothetical protein
MSATFREQPFAQAHQLSRSGAKRPYLLLDFSVSSNDQQAGHHSSLMYIESTTAFHQGLHDTSSAEAIAAPQVCYRHCHASFPIFWVRQSVVPLPARVSLLGGIYVLTEIADLQAIAFQRCLYHGLTRVLDLFIFIPGGAPKAHEVCYENGVQLAAGVS